MPGRDPAGPTGNRDAPAVARSFPRRVGISLTLCRLGMAAAVQEEQGGSFTCFLGLGFGFLTAFLCSTSLLSTANLGTGKARLESGLKLCLPQTVLFKNIATGM